MSTLAKPEPRGPKPPPRLRRSAPMARKAITHNRQPRCTCGDKYSEHAFGAAPSKPACLKCDGCQGYTPARSPVARRKSTRDMPDCVCEHGCKRHAPTLEADGMGFKVVRGRCSLCPCAGYVGAVTRKQASALLRKSAPARTKRPRCANCGKAEKIHADMGTVANGACAAYAPKRKTRSDKKPRGMRESDVGKAKRTLWKKFAAYVKARDGNQCFTCDRHAEGGSLQAGHMFPGRTGALLFDPLVVFSQCADCNGGERGRTAVFVDRYIKRFGIEQFQAAVARTSREKQWRTHEVRELIAAINRGGADYEALYMEKHGLDVAPATAAARGIE